MSQVSYELLAEHGEEVASTTRALVFHAANQISVEKVPIPRARVAGAQETWSALQQVFNQLALKAKHFARQNERQNREIGGLLTNFG